jgi:Kelch motif/Galactose oxidase, central domain
LTPRWSLAYDRSAFTMNLSSPSPFRFSATCLPLLVCAGLLIVETCSARPAHWTVTGSMLHPRSSHSATLLLDGQVLVAGGYVDSAASNTAELYNPITGVWTRAANLHFARADHTATLLPDGRVLVAGGLNGLDLSQAEIYDPVSDTWTLTNPMIVSALGAHGDLAPEWQGLGQRGLWRADGNLAGERRTLRPGQWHLGRDRQPLDGPSRSHCNPAP